MAQPNYRKFFSESLMIILSVLIALFVNECRSNVISKNETEQMLNNIKNEIQENQAAFEEEMQHHRSIIANIDSVRKTKVLDSLYSEQYGLYFFPVAPRGFFQHIISDVAWEVAVQKNITERVPFSTASKLYEVYDQQEEVTRTVDLLVNVLYERAAYRRENLDETLLMVRDHLLELHGRERALLRKYETALTALNGK